MKYKCGIGDHLNISHNIPQLRITPPSTIEEWGQRQKTFGTPTQGISLPAQNSVRFDTHTSEGQAERQR